MRFLCIFTALLSISILPPRATQAGDALTLNGAGATFPYPLYSKWFSEYRKIDPSVEINYQSIGSGGGIRQLLENTIDFGASDSPMKDEQLAKAKTPLFHFPMVMGAVVLTYNLPGVHQPIKLSPELLADLFLGKIFYWNDPKIVALNPEITLPDVPVMIVHRSDGSGTTSIFTDYLAKVSPEWKSRVGSGTAVKWPLGIGGKGNEGVTGFVKNSPGALGYIELLYAEKNNLQVAHLKNAAGVFVKPEAKSITAAASGFLREMPKDFRVSITNAPGSGAYPISAFTYLLVYRNLGDGKSVDAKTEKLKRFIAWALTEGQKLAASLYYAPLPESLSAKVRMQLKEIGSKELVK
ncbi:MAG: phosphate ABC transporter substrate-binding protein PstS [Cryobacterium sp.]|nr:phosphate ABC transporter substrate-binding protein PstS [Oligoflexia bacterium]